MVVLQLSEHGDVIETQTVRIVLPKVFCQTRSLEEVNNLMPTRLTPVAKLIGVVERVDNGPDQSCCSAFGEK